jgi:hypothetical protein
MGMAGGKLRIAESLQGAAATIEGQAALARVAASQARAASVARAHHEATHRPDLAHVTREAAAVYGRAIDGPTPEREARGEFVVDVGYDDKRVERMARDEGATLIGRLARRGMLTRAQVAAGERYQRDHWRVYPKGKSAWMGDRVEGGGQGDISDAKADAIIALDAARAVLRAHHRSAFAIVEAVLILGETATKAGRDEGMYRNRDHAESRAVTILEGALDALAVHYGFAG